MVVFCQLTQVFWIGIISEAKYVGKSLRVQVKSAPGHFGTYTNSQIGMWLNQHQFLVNSTLTLLNILFYILN